KSLGWEKSTAHESPIQSWNWMVPSVVWASKSGAVAPSCSAMCPPLAGEGDSLPRARRCPGTWWDAVAFVIEADRRPAASAERMPDAKPREAAIVAVGRDPLAAGLDRERGEIRVGNEVAARTDLLAEAREDRPVMRSG